MSAAVSTEYATAAWAAADLVELELAVRSVVELRAELEAQQAQHRDRGNFLTPRLYPTAPFDPWAPADTPTESM